MFLELECFLFAIELNLIRPTALWTTQFLVLTVALMVHAYTAGVSWH